MTAAITKVCCFCDKWESGGIESFLTNILLQMNRTGLEIDLVTTCLCRSIFTERLQQAGVRFVELSGSQHKIPENHRLFAKLLEERRYDVLHVNAFQALSLAYLKQARQAGVPVRIAHAHGAGLRPSRTREIKLLIHHAAGRYYAGVATDLWACSGSAARFFFAHTELSRRQFRFIPNGIEIERFRFDLIQRSEIRAQLGVTNDFVIGNVGRLCAEKNQSFLLDVFAEVVKRRSDSRLLLVGAGEEEAALREKAAALGIAKRVLFYGVTNHVERLYWSMDAFAFPSVFEGLGIAAVEAQAAGLPVLCSDRVPEEARVTPLFTSAPLQNAVDWAALLLRAEHSSDRGKWADAVRQANFDVTEVANTIKNSYVRETNGSY